MKRIPEDKFSKRDRQEVGTCASTYSIIRALEHKKEREEKRNNE